MLPQPGDVVSNHYRLVRVRAQGASSVLFEAVDARDGQHVALKVLRPEVLTVPGITTRFEREGGLLASLTSRHIVRVFDLGLTDKGLPFLALELLEGNDLAFELGRGRMTPGLAVHLVRQACEAIEEAHDRGIVHRDIKPANLFLTREDGKPLVKVLDFGISKQTETVSDLTSFGASLGTPVYMPPEQLQSARDADRRCDVWALAVVLYELVAGRAPFEGQSAHEVAALVLADDPAPPLRRFAPDAPEGLEQALARALHKDVSARTPSANAFRAALEPFDQPPPRMSAAPPTVASPSTAPAQMKRSTFWLAVGAGLTIGLLAISVLILGLRRLRGETTSPLQAAGLVDPEPTVASVLAASSPTDGSWRPCLLSEKHGPAFPALARAGKQPEAVRDLDPLLDKSPKVLLEAPWPHDAASPGSLVVTPLTPLGRVFREGSARVVVLTDRVLAIGTIDGGAPLERIATPAAIAGMERTSPAWVVLVEGDTPIRKLAEVLKRLDNARAPIALAIVAASSLTDPPAAPTTSSCPKIRWQGKAVPPSEQRDVEATMHALAKRCAQAIPSISGVTMDVLVRMRAGADAELCVERREVDLTRLDNCVVQGAKSLRAGDRKAQADHVAWFRMAFEADPVRARCGD